MTREEKKKERYSNSKRIILTILLLFFTSLFLIYNILLLGPIEPIVRYIIIILIIILNLSKTKKRKKILKSKEKKFVISNIILSLIFLLIGLFIYAFYNSLSGLNKNSITYSSSIIVKSDSDLTGIQDLDSIKIGVLDDDSSYEGYIIPNEVINSNDLDDDNDIVLLDSYTELINSLYKNELDAVFMPSSYVNMFSNIEGYENINNETKIIFTKTKNIKKKKSSNSKINKPITVLLTGIDSSIDGMNNNDTSNSDTLIVVTFNPKTLTATMLSIPRDSYVPISCFKNNEKSKITHSGWQGVDCTQKTIENFLDIEIDYYVKLNFKGLVDLVDSIGGIDVEVPKDLCTDSSDRTGEVCIKKGYQHLNGEEALVLARNRKQLARGDIDRGLNQQIVVKGILNAVQNNITNISKLSKVLDSLSRNMDTDFTTDQILSFYNVGKDILRKSKKSATDSINIIQLYLSGKSAYIYDPTTKLDLYYYILYKDSVDKVSDAMNINLNKISPKMDKSFSWSIDENYVHIPLGQNIDSFTTLYYDNNSISARPDFTKKEEKEEDKSYDYEEDDEMEIEEEETKEEEVDEEDLLNTIIPNP